ncbi:MAG TPA: folylpolyglutamate synthase/dihydrofolate synthase family protein [Bacteroidales bacterium]|nr:folylpolyglutamate synthase/dihydrofolate synthase family protein [Bacteroidales bacterium]
MNYEEVIKFMFNSLPMYQRIGKAAYKANLDNTLALDKHFLNPHKNFKTIHIAGTNGKGSVSHTIASILQEAGYKTGLYTSPHLVDYRERIRVNGQMISKQYVQDFINNNIGIIKDIEPSFFEMSVALAFDYFKACKVDIAVVETGMGGRLDSTNIISPILTIITNIGYDHTQFLGKELCEIASEKAGIIKPYIPCIIGETNKETKNVFIRKANEMHAPIIFADQYYSTSLTSVNDKVGIYNIETKSKTYRLEFELAGSYQQRNLATILQSVEMLNNLGINITAESLNNGLMRIKQNTGLRGRWEVIGNNPLTICDTGHNKEGLNYVITQLLSQHFKKLHIVLGFVSDKNIATILSLFPQHAEYYFTQASVPRAMPAIELQKEALKHNLIGKHYENVITAFNSAKDNSDKDDMIFIGGSTFVVGDLLASN